MQTTKPNTAERVYAVTRAFWLQGQVQEIGATVTLPAPLGRELETAGKVVAAVVDEPQPEPAAPAAAPKARKAKEA